MSKKFKSTTFEKHIIPEDEYVARIVSIIDFGTQKNTWQGAEKLQEQVKVQFELVEYSRTWTSKDGEEVEGNAMLSKTYTQTMSPNGNFIKLAKAAMGRRLTPEEEEAFDPDILLGLPVLLEVGEGESDNGKYNKIEGVFRAPKDEDIPKAENDIFSFWLDEESDWDVFEGLHDWLKDIIRKSPEYAELRVEEAPKPAKKRRQVEPEDDGEDELDKTLASKPKKSRSRKKDY